MLVHRYGTKDGCITFDDFMMCAVKLKSMIGECHQVRAQHLTRTFRFGETTLLFLSDLFKEKDPDNTNKATFSLEEWVERTLYS